jgi:hypothetical protein
VHAGPLAEGVASALLYQGPFILSDEMRDLPTLARALRRQVRSYVPLTVPPSLAYGAARPIRPWDAPFTAVYSFPGCSLTSSPRAANR